MAPKKVHRLELQIDINRDGDSKEFEKLGFPLVRGSSYGIGLKVKNIGNSVFSGKFSKVTTEYLLIKGVLEGWDNLPEISELNPGKEYCRA